MLCIFTDPPNPQCRDAEKMESLAKELSSSADLEPKSDGTDLQKILASVADRAKNGEFLYTKFFAIGLFRLLELTGGVFATHHCGVALQPRLD
jgi:Thylakoid formation protein